MSRRVSVRLSDALAAELDRLATALSRPRAWVIAQAVAQHVQEEAAQVTAIAEALEEYRQGNATLLPHDEVMSRLEARLHGHDGDAPPPA